MASKKQGSEISRKNFLLLPRLRAGHGIQVPTEHTWSINDQALNLISRNIDVQNSAEKGHSIPDIFSQSIQFEFDLSIGNADAVGQWQGLLATLLLAGAGGLVRVRDLVPGEMPDSPFLRIFKQVAARRGIARLPLFELKRRDGEYSAVAFRFDGMPTMLCPAAQINGPFAVDDPWIVKNEQGWQFTTPYSLRNDAAYQERRVALRNEIYAMSTRIIPERENRDGLQLSRLKEFFAWLADGADGISAHPVNADVRGQLYTLDSADVPAASSVFTDKLCLLREGDASNVIHASAADSMRIFSGGTPTEWRALLPLKRDWAAGALDQLRGGMLRMRMQWHNGAVDAELLNESDRVIEARRYRIQDLVNYTRHRNAPQIAVWPPKALPGWQRYYLLRYDDGNALPLSMHVLGTGDAAGEVTLLPEMPRGLSFSLEGQEVGVLLPQYGAANNSRSREFNVGFDFGTTNTTAYKHDPATGVTTPVSFAGQGALLLFGRQEGADVALTAQLVSAKIADRATHYSLLRRKGERVSEGGALLQTTIPLLHNAAFNPEIVRDVSDDLKWGTLAADKLRANLFLEQYLMMCLWHVATQGAAAVHWRASYPLSMHGRLQEDFVAKIQTVVAGLCTHCYQLPYDTYFCSESEAVGFMMMDNDIQARHLKGQTVNDQTGFFCVDIGGGSTDFSLWMQRRPLMQASLRWAGNAILSDSVTRENHGAMHPPRHNLLDHFFLPGSSEGKRSALGTPLLEGRYDEFRRIWNVLVDEITDAVKGVHRSNEPLLNYLNIVRMNLYMLFYFGGRMVRESIHAGVRVGMDGVPLPVAVLGNGAKMTKLLYNDVEIIQTPKADGGHTYLAQERRNETRYAEEMGRLTRAFQAGCGIEGFEVTIIEPFMPKQETAYGLALAPEAFLSQRGAPPDGLFAGDWPTRSAYVLDGHGVVGQTMTDEYRELVQGSFEALRDVFGDDEAFREFLASLYDAPAGTDKYNLEAYYNAIWAQCLRHNPEPMLPGQPLPAKDTIEGRYVEMLSAMNRMMKTV